MALKYVKSNPLSPGFLPVLSLKFIKWKIEEEFMGKKPSSSI
jgi:hypothetical protein